MSEDLQEMQRLILSSRNKFRTLVDGIGDEILSIDSGFYIVSVNQTLARSLGLHPREMVGRLCYQVVYGLDHPCPEAGLACPARSARSSRDLETALHELGGQSDPVQYVEVRAMPVVGPSGEAEEIILVRRDVTVQKEAERQIREYNERLEREVQERTAELVVANEELARQRDELEKVNQELRDLERLKQDLTNMVIHDLKGPLGEIAANMELLKYDPLSEDQTEYLEAAEAGSDEITRMIGNLLDISRMEENRLALEVEPFEAGTVLEEIAARYQPLARLSDVSIVTDLGPGLPPTQADRRLFERVLINLVSNAINHTPETGQITLAAAAGEGEAVFEVRDTGPGVPPDLQDKIFEKFSQGKEGRARTSSGLGLAFCRMAVEAHGGRIWVESEPGQGAVFRFTLPQDQPATG